MNEMQNYLNEFRLRADGTHLYSYDDDSPAIVKARALARTKNLVEISQGGKVVHRWVNGKKVK